MLKDYLTKGSPERKLILFISKLILIWISWKPILYILGKQDEPTQDRLFPSLTFYWKTWNNSLVHFVLDKSAYVLEWLGHKPVIHNDVIWIPPSSGVSMGFYCLGIQLMYYFSMLLVITPMSLTKKIISLPAGIAITFFLNITRITSLCLISLYIPEYVVYFHDHVFNVVVFGSLMAFYYFLTKEK
jgi:exosortase/archaeosortase family protein